MTTSNSGKKSTVSKKKIFGHQRPTYKKVKNIFSLRLMFFKKESLSIFIKIILLSYKL